MPNIRHGIKPKRRTQLFFEAILTLIYDKMEDCSDLREKYEWQPDGESVLFEDVTLVQLQDLVNKYIKQNKNDDKNLEIEHIRHGINDYLGKSLNLIRNIDSPRTGKWKFQLVLWEEYIDRNIGNSTWDEYINKNISKFQDEWKTPKNQQINQSHQSSSLTIEEQLRNRRKELRDQQKLRIFSVPIGSNVEMEALPDLR